MKATKIIAMVTALVLACALAACAGGSMGLEPLDEANGVKVTAENAGADNAVDAEAAFTNTFKEEQKAAPVSPAGTSAPDSKTQTGDPATMALVLLALVISGSLMALMAKRSRQH